MAAAVVGLFESTIAALAVLTAYMPVVAGMDGNAGIQTMDVQPPRGHIYSTKAKRR